MVVAAATAPEMAEVALAAEGMAMDEAEEATGAAVEVASMALVVEAVASWVVATVVTVA